MSRPFRILVVATCALLATPLLAAAQDVAVVARPNAEVFLVTDDGRTRLGTVSEFGELAVREDRIDRGRDLEVVLELADRGTNVALVERGRVDTVCGDDGRDVVCRRTGTFVTWGRVARISVSPTGEVAVEGAGRGDRDEDDQPDDDGLRWGIGIIARADGGRAFLSNDERLCEEADALLSGVAFTCDVENTAPAWSAGVGVTLLRVLSLEAGYQRLGRLDFQLDSADLATPVSLTGAIHRTHGPTFQAGLRLDVGWPIVPVVHAGAWRWSTDIDATAALPGTSTALTTSRSLNGWSPVFDAGIEVWPIRNVGFYGGVRWISLDEDLQDLSGLLDVDEHFRIVFVGVKIAVR